MYFKLNQQGDEELAIRYAERLDIIHKGKTPSDAIPSTSVYKLVRSLNKYIER